MSGHIPIRSCAVCRVHLPKYELLRFALSHICGKSGYVLDEKQILPGRGIYLCTGRACLERGRKKLSIIS